MFLAACDDDLFLVEWTENPQEAVLFALDRDELNSPSAYNMLTRLQVVIEDPSTEGGWDFALDRQNGRMVFLTPRVLGIQSDAALVPFPGVDFEEMREAPSDTLLYVTDKPVPVELGTIYVVRTHEQIGSYGRICFYYGKLEPLEIDLQAGVLRFLQDTSPDCNNRSLVPPR
jgi:hypothetical protein